MVKTIIVINSVFILLFLLFYQNKIIIKNMNYTLGSLIGKGSDGEVYELIENNHIKEKVIKFIQPSIYGIRNYLEPYILLHLDHDCIMKAEKIEIEDDGLLKIIQDKADIDLNKKNKRNIKINQKLKYMRQLTEAVYFLQRHSIIHGDIKPHNILLHKDNVKLSDFSLARIITKEPLICYKKPYKLAYRTPELKNNTIYLKSDIWALACTLYEIFYGHCYFSISKERKNYHISDNKAEEIFDKLIEEMLNTNVTQRLSIEDIIIFFNINKATTGFILTSCLKFNDCNINAKYLQKCYYEEKLNKMSKKYTNIEKNIAQKYNFDVFKKIQEGIC